MKVGILGLGYMGQIRRDALRGRGDVELVRVFHTDASAPMHAERWQDVVDDPAIDAVLVCLPNHLTCEVTVRALRAGKHVFAEKPPGVSAAEVRAMQEAERASGRTLQFGFDLRQHDALLRAHALVRDGELGRVRWLRGVYGKPRDPSFEQGWRADRALAGGGILLDQGIHMLDLLLWLSGGLSELHAFASPTPPQLDEDTMVILRGPSGVLASLHSSHSQSPPTFVLDLGLERGTIHVEGLVTRSGRYGPETIAWGPPDAPRAHAETFTMQRAWDRELDAFFAAAATGARPTTGTSDDALAIMLLVDRIHAAAGEPGGSR